MKIVSILGKIIFFTFLPIGLYANVTATLSHTIATKGDVVTLNIEAIGNTIVFPTLNNINGQNIIGTSTSQEIQIINSLTTKKENLKLDFIAETTMKIDPIEIIIDNKSYKTKILNLIVKEPEASKKGATYQLKLTLDKEKVYVGEAIMATVEFKYKTGSPISKASLDKLEQKHFWVKNLPEEKQFKKREYTIYKQKYLIFPQLAGKHTIEKQSINIATTSRRTFFQKWNKIYSNSKNIEVIPLPENINIQGKYNINAKIDKNSIEANKPVNLTLNIEGFGNIDDIESFKLNLKNPIVYDSKPTLDTYIKNGIYGGLFTQKFSIIADQNFTIKPIIFQYFDPNSKSIKTITTKEFKINVKKSNNPIPQILKQNSNISTNNNKEQIVYIKENYLTKYIFAFIGLLIGLFISNFSKLKYSKKAKKAKTIDVKIKKSKNNKELYNLLLPYSHIDNVKIFIKKLEDNIYNNSTNIIDKKQLIKILSGVKNNIIL